VQSLTGFLPSFESVRLFAAGNRPFGQWVNRSQDFEGTDILGLLFVLAGMLVLVFVAWGFSYWQKWRELRVIDSPRALFKELCAAHSLDRADRELLYEIAQWHQLADPVQLFVEPRLFEPGAMHQDLDCDLEVQELQSRLFTIEPAQVQAASPV
jgi:hypothetical protein